MSILYPWVVASLCVFISPFAPSTAIADSDITVIAEEDALSCLSRTRQYVARITHDDVQVLEVYDALMQELSHAFIQEKSISFDGIRSICAAIAFGADKHRFQTRKNTEKTPYISHPLSVGYYLVKHGGVRDPAILSGALLHDTLDQTQTTWEELSEKFGNTVAGYVKEMTEDKGLSQQEKKRKEVIHAATRSKAVAQIAMADKLYNIKDLTLHPPVAWSQVRKDHYVEWVQSVIDRLPAANPSLRAALEDAISAYWEQQASAES